MNRPPSMDKIFQKHSKYKLRRIFIRENNRHFAKQFNKSLNLFRITVTTHHSHYLNPLMPKANLQRQRRFGHGRLIVAKLTITII